MNKILKFGGSSLATPECIKNVMDIIIQSKKDNSRISVVLSAFGGVTDQLIKIAMTASRAQNYRVLLQQLESRHIALIRALTNKESQSNILTMVQKMFNKLRDVLTKVFDAQELSLRQLDLIMSFGEQLSAHIISHALKSQSIKTEFLDARKLIRTNECFGSALVDCNVTYCKIKDYFKERDNLQIVTGFIALSNKGNTTTLGRGGSDYTAALFGAALNADEIEIWTDVDGVMAADPKKVVNTFSIKSMSYEEAMEMSSFGARVLYPPTIRPARDMNIPIRIKNSFNPYFSGTLISHIPSRARITGISSVEHIALLRVQGAGMIGVVGIAQRLFGALAKKDISVILISQASSEHSICCAIKSQFVHIAKKAVEKEFAREIRQRFIDKVVIEDDLLIITVVGENMRKIHGVSGKLFQALGREKVNVISIAQGSSERNISVVINKRDEIKALNVIYSAFFSAKNDKRTRNDKRERNDKKSLQKREMTGIFLVGTGNIGSALLNQIKNSTQPVCVIGIANDETMIFSNSGISLSHWRKKIEAEGKTVDMNKFVEKMKELNNRQSVFVDCTASKSIVSYYEDILRSGISIVTPNKIASSGTYKNYKKLKDIAHKKNAMFLYETNVGAGLPIISTIRDLISSGDKILKIEAILSGTLSYIFNSFTGNKKFSQIVKQAKEKGYTEPDPRNDLSGLDVARKLLILAREIGHSLEIEEIKVKNLVPRNFQKIRSVDAFLKQLPDLDLYFENKRKQAEDKGKVLRYIAILKNGKANVSLQSVDNRHPFYNLSGSDNIISITSRNYKDQPLVIKGPGAGPEVTAGGIFADILRVK